MVERSVGWVVKVNKFSESQTLCESAFPSNYGCFNLKLWEDTDLGHGCKLSASRM